MLHLENTTFLHSTFQSSKHAQHLTSQKIQHFYIKSIRAHDILTFSQGKRHSHLQLLGKYDIQYALRLLLYLCRFYDQYCSSFHEITNK